jgi:fructan beta-fructosidase
MKYIIYLLLIILGMTACQSEKTEEDTAPEPTTYEEPYRPQLHFSPAENWMNDPNGMFFYEDEYHLFYQYYPDSTVWGPMHWGHAVSTDMIHWQHLPIALYPDSLGYIFSGSAVVDWNNTSGFGTEDNPPIVAIFTHHDPQGERDRIDFQNQSIAYSLDRGQSWTKYADNPVVPNPGIRDFRDPKVSRHEASQSWVMILAAKDRVHLYRSPDLKSWTFASEFGANLGGHGGVWECPDLFPLASEDNMDIQKWVMLVSINPGGPNGGSATQYFIGDFDGQTFTLDPEFAPRVQAAPDGNEQAVWLDYGPDNYAGVTFSDIPESDGRRIFMGWMSNWAYAQQVPTSPWRSAMTLPRTLSLKQSPQGWIIRSRPVLEFNNLRTGGFEVLQGPTEGEKDITQAIPRGPLPVEINLQALASPTEGVGRFGLKLSNDAGEYLLIGFDPVQQQYFIDRTQAGPATFSDAFAKLLTAPKLMDNPTTQLQLIIDRSSVELFADYGSTVMTALFYPSQDFNHVSLFAEGGELEWQRIEGRSLQAVW